MTGSKGASELDAGSGLWGARMSPSVKGGSRSLRFPGGPEDMSLRSLPGLDRVKPSPESWSLSAPRTPPALLPLPLAPTSRAAAAWAPSRPRASETLTAMAFRREAVRERWPPARDVEGEGSGENVGEGSESSGESGDSMAAGVVCVGVGVDMGDRERARVSERRE